jgi:hypothetical protein
MEDMIASTPISWEESRIPSTLAFAIPKEPLIYSCVRPNTTRKPLINKTARFRKVNKSALS